MSGRRPPLAVVFVSLLGLLGGCAETPERAADARPGGEADGAVERSDLAGPDGGDAAGDGPDGGADAGPGRPPGAACVEDADCAGICVPGEVGARCAAPCSDDQDCPPAASRCAPVGGRRVCQAPAAALLGPGASCDDPEARCAPPGRCVDDGLSGARCRSACAQEGDCPAGLRCAADGVCLVPEADAFTCATRGCLDPGLRCVRLRPDGPARCAASCFDQERPCPDGGECVTPVGVEGRVCGPVRRGAGALCGAGDDCEEGLVCLARAPGDPAARCAQPCAAGACAPGFVCRRPTGLPEPWCLPAPFGVGDEGGAPGDGCATHGATDCAPDLDCVAGVAGRAVCAAPCPSGVCPAGARCVARRIDGPYCLQGDGDFGSACVDDADCDAGPCAPAADPEARFCSAPCPAQACPAAAVCEEGLCRPADPGPAAPLGTPCGDGVLCETGLCAADPTGGPARCSQTCEAPAGACPPGFSCRSAGASGLCFPEERAAD